MQCFAFFEFYIRNRYSRTLRTTCADRTTGGSNKYEIDKMHIMKRVKLMVMVAVAASAALMMQSCLKEDNSYYSSFANALVTVKNVDDGSVYLQLDDRTTLLPVNLKSSPFDGKEVRALTNIRETDDPSGAYDKSVYVNWIDSIRTKPAVPAFGTAEENDEAYGTDPVEIVNDWVTVAEDGYLTLRFRTRWGNNNVPHYVNLLTGVNTENPYEVEFRHDANDDEPCVIGDALVAFRLSDLPDTNGETVKLKLVWKSYSGEKSVEFDYCSREGDGATIDTNGVHYSSMLR